jgi:hypothetical protein
MNIGMRGLERNRGREKRIGREEDRLGRGRRE